jgi:LUD domain
VDSNKAGWIDQRCQKAVEKLRSHDFDAIYVKTKGEAAQEILKHVTPDTKIGVGGSITLRELGVLDTLKARGNKVYDHWTPGLSREQSLEIRKAEMTSDLFLSSSNAVTLTGELVNIDGFGNRVNAMTFGPGKVILVAGYNKIVGNVDEAIKRVRNEATPPNARRLNVDVPCANLGWCVDCNSPNRVCRVIVIHERKPMFTDILVILVGEDLGY